MNLKPALLLALTPACAAPASEAAPSKAGPALSARSTILVGAQAKVLFKQCSRSSPRADGFWKASARDVAGIEALFTRYWHAQNKPENTRALATYRRQYAGFMRGGRKMIYLNAVHVSIIRGSKWKREAYVVCDGGASYFGAIYDVSARKWSELDFNGEI